jgi:hypothetical protein
MTHRKEDITKIHKNVNDCADPREIDVIAAGDKEDGQDVMGKHLPVILSWLFRMNHVDLVEPPPELSEVVEFRQAG